MKTRAIVPILGALKLQLTSDDLRVISEQMAQIQVHGEHLPESALKMTGLRVCPTRRHVRRRFPCLTGDLIR